jgi:FkbM family methyltransferase
LNESDLNCRFGRHKVFEKFKKWAGNVPAGHEADFLGSRYRTAFFTLFPPQPHDRYEEPSYPAFDEEYFEWVDLLQAVELAHGLFTMLELGAGFGRWTARGAAAATQRGLPYTFVAVEAEPTHFEWLIQNLQDNDVKLENCRLIRAAVTSKDGKVAFKIGDPANDYGQYIGGSTQVDTLHSQIEVEAVSLSTLLQPLEHVDLIDMDVQGAELEIVQASLEPLNQKVRRIHIETHWEALDSALLKLFRSQGWKPHFIYASNTADKTPWGRINFQGGVQSWLNPRLHKTSELRGIRTLQNSLAWRTFKASSRVFKRAAPPGAQRLVKAMLSGIAKKYQRDSEDIKRRD